jgi:hypothetical protein
MDILSKHLQTVTKIYNQDPVKWRVKSISSKNMDLNFNFAEKRAQYDEKSVDLRNQGNEHFKAGRFPEARLLYTQSIAAAIGGSLGALAYSNRYQIISSGTF